MLGDKHPLSDRVDSVDSVDSVDTVDTRDTNDSNRKRLTAAGPTPSAHGGAS